VITAIFIGLVGVLILGLAILMIQQVKYDQAIHQIERRLQSQPTPQKFTEAMIAGLPAPVQRYFLHAIALGTPLPTVAKLYMRGHFRLAPDQPWLPMQAQEIITPQGFVWKASIGRGLSQFKGADYYLNRVGCMRFVLLGCVPVAQMQNPNTARSAIGRLAAELIWLPSALLPQQGVQWRAIDEYTIEAQIKQDDEPVTLTLSLDDTGKVLASSARRWGNQTSDRRWTYIPMGGQCHTEQTFGGLTIPSRVSVGWWFGSAHYFEFFQATIEQVEI
jgi:hypothetical protein